MNYFHAIIAINSACIAVLAVLTVFILFGTRLTDEKRDVVAIIILPTIPIYIYNLSRFLGYHEVSAIMFPWAHSVNTLQMPLLWMFTKRIFDMNFKFKSTQLLHILPMILCFILCVYLGKAQWMEYIRYEMTGDDSWVGDLNSGIIAIQLLIYSSAIFIYVLRIRKQVGDTLSDAEWAQKEWILNFMILLVSSYILAILCHFICPQTDVWLMQILNVIAMIFLGVGVITHPNTRESKLPNTDIQEEILIQPKDKESVSHSPLKEFYMREICEKTQEYLISSKAYLQHDLSLSILAQELKVSQRFLSQSINTYLNCNFFTLVNQMRVEEAKRRLINLDTSEFNIDSIYTEVGFRSRSTFFLVFKKLTGKTPAAWLTENKTLKH